MTPLEHSKFSLLKDLVEELLSYKDEEGREEIQNSIDLATSNITVHNALNLIEINQLDNLLIKYPLGCKQAIYMLELCGKLQAKGVDVEKLLETKLFEYN